MLFYASLSTGRDDFSIDIGQTTRSACIRLISSSRSPAVSLRHLSVVYMKEVSLPDYHVAKPVREVLCECEMPPADPSQAKAKVFN